MQFVGVLKEHDVEVSGSFKTEVEFIGVIKKE